MRRLSIWRLAVSLLHGAASTGVCGPAEGLVEDKPGGKSGYYLPPCHLSHYCLQYFGCDCDRREFCHEIPGSVLLILDYQNYQVLWSSRSCLMAHKGLPHNAILNYNSEDFSHSGWTAAGKVNLARDYSLINRQHWEQTTAKGVPLVYRCALTFSPELTDFGSDGTHPDIFRQDPNQVQIVTVKTAQQNWVQRNGCVKAHAAREAMFRHQGVKKSDRGAYDKTMHIAWSAGVDTFLTPKDGDRANYTLASWEYSKLIFPDDPSGAYLNVIDTHSSEESTTSHTVLSIPQMYLASRKQLEDDSNADDDDENPQLYSVLNRLLSLDGHSATMDEVVDLARDNQDERPYDLSETGNDTEPVEAARVFLGITSGVQQTVVIDIPYGLFEMSGANAFIDAGAELTNGVDVRVEVLDIFPMGEG